MRLLDVDLKTGLLDDEVQRRQKKFGLNRITARRVKSSGAKFLQQFNEPLLYILLLAGAVTAALGEWVDSSVIFGVVIINAIVGFLQESKAEKAIEALARMVVIETTVRRSGRKLRVRAEELVPGDVVLEEARTAVVNVVAMVQAFYLLNSRSLSRSMFSVGVFSNRWVWLGIAAMAAAQLLFTYAPFMHTLFHTATVRAEAWIYIMATAVGACAVVEFEKWVRFHNRRTATYKAVLKNV